MIQNEYDAYVMSKLSTNHQLIHTIIGVAGEWAELDQLLADELFGNLAPSPNYTEEVGDLYFYYSAYFQIAQQEGYQIIDPDDYPVYVVHETLCTDVISDILDKFKRWYIYRSEPFSKLHAVMLSSYNLLRKYHDQTVFQLANVDKLSKRYKAGFTPEEAAERKDKCEDSV